MDMCVSLYAHFLRYLQDASYYPPRVEQVSNNRLFAMFHSCTDEHNKRVVMSSLSQADGVVRVVFATMALGMGVDFKSRVACMNSHVCDVFRKQNINEADRI